MKKLWMAGVALFAACCISAPGLVSYIQAQENAKQESGSYQEEEDMGLAGRIAAIGVGAQDIVATASEVEPEKKPGLSVTAAEPSETVVAPEQEEVQQSPVEEEPVEPEPQQEPIEEPVEPESQQTASRGSCAYYVDENGDGICDHCTGSSGQGQCAYYVDENGDGVCDHCTGSGGQGQCAYYVDDNGDGVCDHCTGGSSGQQGGYGHHGGGGHHRQRHCR